ncbi:MAG: sigma-70 family RNA polymerase sigma factor [Myxococcales bacterium]|nr:MAG: sigma-70 family RNA polymerase sigma factor [Myxococcales bacterium]
MASRSVIPADPRSGDARAEAREAPRRRSVEEELRIAQALGEHFETVWRSLRRFGVGESQADDAAQHVFVAFAARIEVVELGRERPYLLGIAARVAANFRRQHARLREEPVESVDVAPSSERNPESLLVQQQRREQLDRALATLPDLQRQVFVLYELEGFSLPEIARALEIPLGTATSRLRRARDAFEAWVDQHLPSPSGDS